MSSCSFCDQKKNLLTCCHCGCDVCKKCVEILSEETFQYSNSFVFDENKVVYCRPCYDKNIEPKLLHYNEIVEKAKDVNVYFYQQAKETQFMSRSQTPLKVIDCTDRNEAVMKLAFMAAEKGFNGLIQVQVKDEKVRMGSYQTQKFHATGIPTNIKASEIIKSRSFWTDPN